MIDMKKNLLLVLGLGLGLNATAQVGIKNLPLKEKPTKSVESITGYHNFSNAENTFTPKAGGDTLFSDNFETANNWTFDNAGQTGADFGWAVVSTSRKWYQAINNRVNSVSGGKFLEVMNGVYNNGNPNSATGIVYTATSKAIAIPNNNVTVSFRQYGALFNDSQIMEVSSDSTNWVQVFTNNDRTVFNGGDASAIYANPEFINVNIGTAGIPSTATNLYVRYKFTSRFDSQTNGLAWITFGWMIDDFTVTENLESDLRSTGSFVSSAGIRYSKIPTSQKHDVPVANTMLNNGSLDLTDVKSYMKLTTPTTTINDTILVSPSLASYAADTAVHEIVLTNEGTYSVSDLGVTFNGVDEDTTNNKSNYNFSFNFGGSIYALDQGTATNYDYENDNAEYHVGNAFDIYQNVEATGIDIYLYASTNGSVKSTEGTEIFGAIRRYDSGFPLIDATPLFQVSASDNNKWSTLVFEQPVALTSNSTYLVTVGTYGSGDQTGYDLVIGGSGVSLGGTSLAYYGTDWYRASGATPMVRLNLTPGIVSTKNIAESVKANVYPNPAKDNVVIDYNTAFDGDVKVSIVDLTGKAVYANSFANQAAGNNKIELNVNNFTAGVYQVVIEANSSIVTKKLVIK